MREIETPTRVRSERVDKRPIGANVQPGHGNPTWAVMAGIVSATIFLLMGVMAGWGWGDYAANHEWGFGSFFPILVLIGVACGLGVGLSLMKFNRS